MYVRRVCDDLMRLEVLLVVGLLCLLRGCIALEFGLVSLCLHCFLRLSCVGLPDFWVLGVAGFALTSTCHTHRSPMQPASHCSPTRTASQHDQHSLARKGYGHEGLLLCRLDSHMDLDCSAAGHMKHPRLPPGVIPQAGLKVVCALLEAIHIH